VQFTFTENCKSLALTVEIQQNWLLQLVKQHGNCEQRNVRSQGDLSDPSKLQGVQFFCDDLMIVQLVKKSVPFEESETASAW
jgi:hypothetical protein